MPWWAELYWMQHEIWPAWSRASGDASAVAELLAHLWDRDPGRAVDLGCGSGRELCALAERGWTGLGLDLDAALLERARRRALRAEVASALTFGQVDLLTAEPDAVVAAHADRLPAELLLCWDSVLSIWPASTQAALVARWSRLAPSGMVVIGQLHRGYFAERGSFSVSLQGEGVGPGRTERSYRWSEHEGVLHDAVTWFPPDDAAPQALPVQRLHLTPVSALVDMLRAAGLREVQAFGSDGWSWTVPPQPPTGESGQIVVVGRG